jgi:hypothetical protein
LHFSSALCAYLADSLHQRRANDEPLAIDKRDRVPHAGDSAAGIVPG